MTSVPVPAAPTLAAATDAEVRRVFAKIGWRVMPILTTAYILNYLDRTNIAFAALTMRQAIGLTQTQLGVGAGIFFLGYCLLEVPSNVALYRFGARVWISRIMITWGIASAAMAFAVGPNSFYFFRLLLGAAEAGFFPGVAFYLATWFPREYRTRIIAWFMVAIPISSVIGGPLSGLLLAMDGWLGLAGWQWLFIVEGLPAVIVGLMLLTRLTDRPEDATWLTADERRIVREQLAVEIKPKEVHRFALALARRARADPGRHPVRVPGRLLRHRHLPAADSRHRPAVGHADRLRDQRLLRRGQRDDDRVGRPRGSPRQQGGEPVGGVPAGRRWGSPARSSLRRTSGCRSLAITVAVSGVNAARAIFWTIPPRFLSGLAAAGGLAFINSIGTSGGFVGPTIMGWLTDRTGSFLGRPDGVERVPAGGGLAGVVAALVRGRVRMRGGHGCD